MEHIWVNITSMFSGACFAFIATIFAARRGMVEKSVCNECKTNLTAGIKDLKDDMKEVKASIAMIDTNIAIITTTLGNCSCGKHVG